MSALQFNEATHTYTLGGQVIPGVTSVMQSGGLVDLSMVDPDVLEAKSQLGKAVHLATHLDDLGNLDEQSVDELAMGYVQAYRKWRRESGAVIPLSEHMALNLKHRYAGTLDLLVSINGEEWLIDKKTSSQIHRAAGVQTAAYEEALNLGRRVRRGALQLKPDGTYRLHEFTSPRDFVVFQACLLIHRFKQENQHV